MAVRISGVILDLNKRAMNNSVEVKSFYDLESMNLTQLNSSENNEIGGGFGKWGFIGRAAIAAFGTTVGVALIAGIVVGYIAYEVYEHYTSEE